jgi:hypothetical protein
MIESYWLRTLAFLLLVTLVGFGVYTVIMWAISIVQIGGFVFGISSLIGVGSWPN